MTHTPANLSVTQRSVISSATTWPKPWTDSLKRACIHPTSTVPNPYSCETPSLSVLRFTNTTP
jgi:hypothetical protein